MSNDRFGFNEQGNMPRPGVIPRFSDLEVAASGLAAEAPGFDSEFLLFSRLKGYRREMPHLISRWQYNDRHKSTVPLCQRIRQRMTREMDGGRLFLHRFQADSGRPARAKHCTTGRKDAGKAPSYGYCAWHNKRWQCQPKAANAPPNPSFHPNLSIRTHRHKPANAGSRLSLSLGLFSFAFARGKSERKGLSAIVAYVAYRRK